jgi:hypothetical protein
MDIKYTVDNFHLQNSSTSLIMPIYPRQPIAIRRGRDTESHILRPESCISDGSGTAKVAISCRQVNRTELTSGAAEPGGGGNRDMCPPPHFF